MRKQYSWNVIFQISTMHVIYCFVKLDYSLILHVRDLVVRITILLRL